MLQQLRIGLPLLTQSSLQPRQTTLGYVAAFILHTLIVYTCAINLSQWLVFHWFRWVAPIFSVSTSVPPPDWYLQHFELMTILPALLTGYVNVARFLPNAHRTLLREGRHSIATWAWVLPTLVLLYRMLEYRAPAFRRSRQLFRIHLPATLFGCGHNSQLPHRFTPGLRTAWVLWPRSISC